MCPEKLVEFDIQKQILHIVRELYFFIEMINRI